MTEALSYFDAFRGGYTGANLIQAQRDCFGAHTFERTDREGTFHHDWGKRIRKNITIFGGPGSDLQKAASGHV